MVSERMQALLEQVESSRELRVLGLAGAALLGALEYHLPVGEQRRAAEEHVVAALAEAVEALTA